MIENAGLRLWEAQKSQGTGLCVGLDPHIDPKAGLGEEFYIQFASPAIKALFVEILDKSDMLMAISRAVPDVERAAAFVTGVVSYFTQVIDAAWKCGIRVYKPQSAFYERLGVLGPIALSMICRHIDLLAFKSKESFFKILDCKRGDIFTTQEPYYATVLTGRAGELFPGANGLYGFDTMTITTWMGEDVITPGKQYFEQGNGAIIVTRSSNPSGTTQQDLYISPNHDVELSAKQEAFRYTFETEAQLTGLIGRQPMAHELMLFLTEKFSREHGLNIDGVSPLFSVMGSTVKMLPSFRQIRPGGIALVPGFGGQQGEMKNVMPLYVQEGPLAGHLGILSSSRNHNYPWMKKFGGSGDPVNLESEMKRVIEDFRKDERWAYSEHGLWYPF